MEKILEFNTYNEAILECNTLTHTSNGYEICFMPTKETWLKGYGISLYHPIKDEWISIYRKE